MQGFHLFADLFSVSVRITRRLETNTWCVPLISRGDRLRTSVIRDHEETCKVEKTKQYQSTTRRIPVARVAAATMAVLTLSALMVVPDAAQAASSHSAKGVVVSVAKNSKFGTILVSGKTLYTLKSSATACGTKCLKIWPELLLPKGVTKVTAGLVGNAAKLGTVTRTGGGLQVTYAGKPLYWFYKDTTAGQVNGVSTGIRGARGPWS